MRLYISAVCSILTYGSEAWMLTPEVRRALNGANTAMMSVITGEEVRKEAGKGKTFDLVRWVRARRLQWMGHILRLEDTTRLLQYTRRSKCCMKAGRRAT